MIRVKNLEFSGIDVHEARPIPGLVYEIQVLTPGWVKWWCHGEYRASREVGSYDSAVAACQAHYDAIILSQIEVEPLVFAVQHEFDDVKVWCATYGRHEFKIRCRGDAWDYQYHDCENDVVAIRPAESYADAAAKCNAKWRQVVLSGANKEQESA